jgi:dolichol-phosphate mannosyltransferase
MLSIILPTYNEKDSIIRTIESIKKVIPKNQKYEIIVADDNSPDKTWDLVNKTYSKSKNIYSIRRMKNRGLAPAVIEGFENAKGDYLAVMDADGQHDEKILPLMIKAIKKNDLVIGSRFVKGGSVEGWSKKRLAGSKAAAALAKPLLKNKVNDPMSGFFMLTKELFNKVKPKLDGMGYKILLDILFQTKKIKIEEIGFKFRIRDAGESKISSKVIIEYLLMLLKQAYRTNKRLLKFLIVGTSGVLVNLGIYTLLTRLLNSPELLSLAIAIEISIITNFILNNYWTWNHIKSKSSFFTKLLKFNLTSLVGAGINMGIFHLLYSILNMHDIISNLIGIMTATAFNFIINNIWTFKNDKK